MKSIENICCKGKPALTFPRLMRGKQSGAVYLVNITKDGSYEQTVVNGVGRFSNGNVDIGHSITATKIDYLEDYDGTITLSND